MNTVTSTSSMQNYNGKPIVTANSNTQKVIVTKRSSSNAKARPPLTDRTNIIG